MYNSNYLCKYTLDSTDDEPYREDILNIFEIAEFDVNIVTNTLDTIYEKFKNDEMFKHLLVSINVINKYSFNDLALVFVIMYSYDYMYLIHPCVCDLINFGKMSPEHLKLVSDTINIE